MCPWYPLWISPADTAVRAAPAGPPRIGPTAAITPRPAVPNVTIGVPASAGRGRRRGGPAARRNRSGRSDYVVKNVPRACPIRSAAYSVGMRSARGMRTSVLCGISAANRSA